nr:DUF234 domain-containing protein [Lachnospiraceae bacterium]
REPSLYNTLLGAMACNMERLNDLFHYTGFSRAKISVYLKNLMELGIVNKVYSHETANTSDVQKGLYRIQVPSLSFYYRFIYNNLSDLYSMSGEDFYKKHIEESLSSVVESRYRDICAESLSNDYDEVGEWVGKNGSIDIVAYNSQGDVCVGACSYQRTFTKEDFEWLVFSAQKAYIKPKEYILFSEEGFDDDIALLEGDAIIKFKSIDQSMR